MPEYGENYGALQAREASRKAKDADRAKEIGAFVGGVKGMLGSKKKEQKKSPMLPQQEVPQDAKAGYARSGAKASAAALGQSMANLQALGASAAQPPPQAAMRNAGYAIRPLSMPPPQAPVPPAQAQAPVPMNPEQDPLAPWRR